MLKRVVSARASIEKWGWWKHDLTYAHLVARVTIFFSNALSLTGKERKKERLFLFQQNLEVFTQCLIFVLHRYPAKAEDMQLWPWKATETHRIAWAMVNAVTTCFLMLAVAIRVTLTSNYAYRSQCHGQHITATSDEVRQVLWETKTIIAFISGNSFPSIPSR